MVSGVEAEHAAKALNESPSEKEGKLLSGALSLCSSRPQ